MVHIAIVDDDPTERARIIESLDYITKKNGTEFKTTEFSDGNSFLGTYTPGYDIVLMGIEMPGIDGLETARKLRAIDKTVLLMFVTRIAKLAVNGYEVDALDFIVKPIDKYGFALKMSRALSRLSATVNENLFLRVDGEFISIRLGTLQYIETDGHYLIYHTPDGAYREYASLKSAEKKVGRNFVRCNSCYLVNLYYVTGVSKNKVHIAGQELPISRPKKKSFMDAFTSFIGGGSAR